MPEASAAAAFSPTALIFNPTLVLNKYIVDSITITYPKYTKESCRKKPALIMVCLITVECLLWQSSFSILQESPLQPYPVRQILKIQPQILSVSALLLPDWLAMLQ